MSGERCSGRRAHLDLSAASCALQRVATFELFSASVFPLLLSVRHLCIDHVVVVVDYSLK